MIEGIIRWSVANRLMVVLLSLILATWVDDALQNCANLASELFQ